MDDRPAPLWRRLLTILTARAQALDCDTLQISHRPLARELGCSPAMLPRLMRRLEELGAIARVPYKNGYLVELTHQVIDHHRPSDRSLPDPVIDHLVEVIDHSTPQTSDRAGTPQMAVSPRPQRDALMESDMIQESGRQADATALADWAAVGVNAKVVPELLAFNLTPGRFRELVHQASKLRSVDRPVGFVIGQLRSGRLNPTAPREERHGSRRPEPHRQRAGRPDSGRRLGGSGRGRSPAAPAPRIDTLPFLDLAQFGLDPDGRPLRL